jgi:antibiotic biosynthesis monooxygenase (ABM) superfamily enzyme
MSRFNVNADRSTGGNTGDYETIGRFDDLDEAKRFADASGEVAWVEQTTGPFSGDNYAAHKTPAYLKLFGAIAAVVAVASAVL